MAGKAVIQTISVEEEFRKNPEMQQKDLDSLREWVKKQPHLPDVPELQLILFLHSCLYSIEFAKRTIENYYTIRTHVPEFFSQRDPLLPAMKHISEMLTIVTLPEPLKGGGRVVYMKLHNTNPAKWNLVDSIKYFMFVKDIVLQQSGTSGEGHVGVMDFEGVQLGHMTKLGIITLKKIITYVQDAMPTKLKAVHFVNPGPFIDMLFNMAKPFMHADLLALVHIHGQGMDSFYEHVEKRMLPKELGGEAPSIEVLRRQTMDQVIAYRDYLLNEEKLRVVEAKRMGPQQNAGNLFGVEGSFKKLDID